MNEWLPKIFCLWTFMSAVLFLWRMQLARLERAEKVEAAAIADANTTAKQLDVFYDMKRTLLRRNGTSQVNVSFVQQTGDLVFVGEEAFRQFPGQRFMVVALGTNGKAAMPTLVALIKAAEKYVMATHDQATLSVEELLEAARVCAHNMLRSPSFDDAKRALAEEGVEAVVWLNDGILKLQSKPVLPSQVEQAFGKVDVGRFELRLLQTEPSCYVLGAGQDTSAWHALPNHARATQHFEMGIVKKAVIMYYES